jgi:hypothetical protein
MANKKQPKQSGIEGKEEYQLYQPSMPSSVWEIQSRLGEGAWVNHPLGKIELVLIERFPRQADRDSGWADEQVELTFAVPVNITELPTAIIRNGEVWDIHNISAESIPSREYSLAKNAIVDTPSTTYKMGVLAVRRAGQSPHSTFLSPDQLVPTEQDSALGGIRIDWAGEFDGLATLLDVDGGAGKRKLSRDGIIAAGIDDYIASLGDASRLAVEAMRQFSKDITGPSQMFALMGQQMVSGFSDAMKEETDKAREAGLAFAAKIKAQQEAAVKIDNEITGRWAKFSHEIYFVLTSKYEVIGFESKPDLDSFLVSRLDSDDYGILMVREHEQWIKAPHIDRVGRLFGIIVKNEGG